MASRITCTRFFSIVNKRPFSTKVASAVKSELPYSKKERPILSTLPNGLNVINQETYLPVSRIAIIAKVGAQDEAENELGVTHCIRSLAGLDTESSTTFKIIRSLQLMGAPLKVTNDREYTIYSLNCLRSSALEALKFLYEIAFESAFKHWQIADYAPKLKIDVEFHKKIPLEVLFETLHKVAFKGGLSNSLYSPDYMIGHHTSQMLEEFVCQHYISKNLVLVAQGVDNDHLHSYLKRQNLPPVLEAQAAKREIKFKSGEIRMQEDLPSTYAALVSEGVGYTNLKEYLSQAILREILGSSQRIEHGSYSTTKLGKVFAESSSNPGSVICISQSYATTGFFGLLVSVNPNDAEKVLKNSVIKMKEIIKTSPSDGDLEIAKQKLKVSLFKELNDPDAGIEDLGISFLAGHSLELDISKEIDAISASDVAAVGAKIAKTKPAYVSYGKLHKTPYLDELV